MKKNLGVLCHISSLASKYGVGDFGKSAYEFIDFLHKNNLQIWQILPLNKTNNYNCPYASKCSISYDEMFVDLDMLVNMGLIEAKELSFLIKLPKNNRVDYKTVKKEKDRLFSLAYTNTSPELIAEVKKYLAKNKDILDYCIYQTLLDVFNITDWRKLDKKYLDKNSKEYKNFTKTYENTLLKYGFYQYILNIQWFKLKNYANSKNVKILGDLPIYPSVESFDVYNSPETFQLDHKFNPLCTGGVPKNRPDENEQNWGTCVYDWDKLKTTGYRYMIDKIKVFTNMFDILRLDHFFGYVEHFEHDVKDPAKSKWVRAGGEELFKLLLKEVKPSQIVVEDLGFIKPECDKIMHDYNLTGMSVLQKITDFGCDKYLPENVNANTIYYLGTHDDNTLLDHFHSLNTEEKSVFCKRLNINYKNDKQLLKEIIHKMLESKSKYVILQIQDLLAQDENSRMNIPGIAAAQWEYRMPENYEKQYIGFE